MGKKRFSQEQIVTPLRQIEVMTGQDNENFYNLWSPIGPELP
jgi:hypothetical protein